MIARVADHCFWLGRYLERAEATARVLQVTRDLALDTGLSPAQCWRPVLVVSGEEAAFRARHGAETGADLDEAVQRHLTWEPSCPSSLRRSVEAARENARAIREVVSLEVWGALNELHLWLAGPDAEASFADDRHGFFRRVRDGCHLALGLVESTMLHDDPYDFILLGVMLERAGQTARALDVHHHALAAEAPAARVETAVLLALLRACASFEPFMKRHRGEVTPGAVAAFLVLDLELPRSIRFALASAQARLARLRPATAAGAPADEPVERLRALHAWVASQPPEALGRGPALHALLTRVVDDGAALCDTVGRELLLGASAPPTAAEAQ